MNGDELEDPGRSQVRQALGRSRGGLTTKVHLAVDGRGLPLSIVLTPGNVNDATAFGQVLDGIRTPRLGTGRPRTTPDRVLGDKAYSSRAIRHLLRRRGIAATIPERRDQAANRHRCGALGGRPPAAGLRQGHLPRPQRRRTMLRPPQAVPRDRDPVRQARRPLPCRSCPGFLDPLAPRVHGVIICQTGPSPEPPRRTCTGAGRSGRTDAADVREPRPGAVAALLRVPGRRAPRSPPGVRRGPSAGPGP